MTRFSTCYSTFRTVAWIALALAAVITILTFIPNASPILGNSTLVGLVSFVELFTFPLMWLMWLVCAVAYPVDENKHHSLVRLWALIDAGILVYLFACWRVNENLLHSQGADLALFVLYGPVVVPLGFVFGWLIFNVLTPHLGYDLTKSVQAVSELAMTWVALSAVAAVQSWLVYFLAQLVRRRRLQLKCASSRG